MADLGDSEGEDTRSARGTRRVLTYGSFDLLHYGHIRLLKRAAALGDFLVVGLSTDEFNVEKGKESFYDYETRKEMLEAIRYVDLVIPETSWDQKAADIRRLDIDVVAMGTDWEGSDRFEYLRDFCELAFLERTPGISTTQVKAGLKIDTGGSKDGHTGGTMAAAEPAAAAAAAAAAEPAEPAGSAGFEAGTGAGPDA